VGGALLELDLMQFPPITSEEDIIQYVNWHCIHYLSNKVYHDWVAQEANKVDSQAWAKNMVASVQLTDCFIDFTCDYILQVSRRKYGGISMLCQIMHNALPIAREYTSFSVSDCVVTGIKQRPCFEIMSGKHGDVCSFVHHSLLKCCQSIWCVMHIQDVLVSCVSSFKKQQLHDTTLTAMIKTFEGSLQRKQIVAYFLFVLRDVEKIFSEDNIMQPRKEEFMFVECNNSSVRTAVKKKKHAMLPVSNDANTTPTPALPPLPLAISGEEMNIPAGPHDCASPRRKKTPKSARDSVLGLKRKAPIEMTYPGQQQPANCTQLSLESDAVRVSSTLRTSPLASASDPIQQSIAQTGAELIPLSISSQNTDVPVAKKKKKKKTKPPEARVQDNYTTTHTVQEAPLTCALEPAARHDHQIATPSHKKHKSTFKEQGIHSLAAPRKKAKTTTFVLSDSGQLPSAVTHFKKQQLLDKNLSLK